MDLTTLSAGEGWKDLMSKEERNLEPKGASSGRKGEDRTGNKGSPRHGAISGQQDALGQIEGKHT